MRAIILAVFLAVPGLANAGAAGQPSLGLPSVAWLNTTWAIQHSPSATTQATISRAAATGVRHVATGVTVCIMAVASQAGLRFYLRDGATGAGTIVWSVIVGAPAGSSFCVSSPPLHVVGTANTALTLESQAAPASTNFATVALTGYSITG